MFRLEIVANMRVATRFSVGRSYQSERCDYDSICAYLQTTEQAQSVIQPGCDLLVLLKGPFRKAQNVQGRFNTLPEWSTV